MRFSLAILVALVGFSQAPAQVAAPRGKVPDAPQSLPPSVTRDGRGLPSAVPLAPLKPLTPAMEAPRPQSPGLPHTPGKTESADVPLPEGDVSVILPGPEEFTRLDSSSLTLRRQDDSWQLWSNGRFVRDLGKNREAAEEAVRLLRNMRATEWARIGKGTVPVVEYGLASGKAIHGSLAPKWSQEIDLKTLRAESVRGAWCLRDDRNIHLNFGDSRKDGEQAVAVCKRYGFNRIAFLGGINNAALRYLYAAPSRELQAPKQEEALVRATQEANLIRTGISLPGGGFAGERLAIDPARCEVRRERGEYVLTSGTEIIARFGMNEWNARDALKLVKELRATEFCSLGVDGSNGVTFFLVDGRPPARVPFFAQGVKFRAESLQVRSIDGHYGIFEEGGRMLFAGKTEEEAKRILQVVKAYGFDQVCQVGNSSRPALKFLAKSNNR